METALLPINRQCLFNKGMQKKKKTALFILGNDSLEIFPGEENNN